MGDLGTIQIQKTKVEITENQYKVIKDKYLQGSPSVEDWLYGVATNIALTEILQIDGVKEEDIFRDVKYIKEITDPVKGNVSKVYLLHQGLYTYDERNNNLKKFIGNLYNLSTTNPKCIKAVQETAQKFYNLMSNFEFLPNSPTLMNAGRDLQQLSACYVVPIEDSVEGWLAAVSAAGIIHKSGGGTGFSASRVRPKGAQVKSTKGIASGPLSPFKMIDGMTNEIKQGSMRRGANMGILSVHHPDIMDFINAKKTPGVLENFNVSVAIDKGFMEAVKKNTDYDLMDPKTKQVVNKMNARFVWDEMVKGAWETGDPGFIVIDRINETDSNPTPALGAIESTNPCGEQPLLPYEPCNLGSINLSKFVKEDSADFDWPRLKECVWTATHFLDNVITVNNYPLPEIEDISKKNRRIGLGVMGWAEALVLLGIPYNDKKAFKKAEELMKFINDNCLEASIELGKSRGIFFNFRNSIYDKNGDYFRGEDVKPRNCARTTIAPTGTIGIAAGLQGAGIEPFFAIAYTRYNAKAIDYLKEGKTPPADTTFWEINPLFRKIAEENDFFGLKEEELWKKIDQNHKSVKGIKEIPEKIQNLFLTSHDLEPRDHIMIQAAFQKYTNNAVSKTINLRKESTVKDVEECYFLAYDNGCKGVTIYRDGSKQFQVLNLGDKKVEKKEEQLALAKPKVRKGNGQAELSTYYKIPTGYGDLHIHINYDEEGPTRVFANISPTGTEVSGLTCVIGILLSKYFELGGDPVAVLRHLNSIKGDKPFGFGINRIDSIPHGIAQALKDHLIKTGKMAVRVGPNKDEKQQLKLNVDGFKATVTIYCPQCYSSNVEMQSGCSEPTCFDCGYSKCS